MDWNGAEMCGPARQSWCGVARTSVARTGSTRQSRFGWLWLVGERIGVVRLGSQGGARFGTASRVVEGFGSPGKAWLYFLVDTGDMTVVDILTRCQRWIANQRSLCRTGLPVSLVCLTSTSQRGGQFHPTHDVGQPECCGADQSRRDNRPLVQQPWPEQGQTSATDSLSLWQAVVKVTCRVKCRRRLTARHFPRPALKGGGGIAVSTTFGRGSSETQEKHPSLQAKMA